MPASAIITNRFVIQDLQRDMLGRGGMGAVYRGIDRLTGETVAIKALNPDLTTSNPESVLRFRREAEALRQLDHPNIVKMFAAVEEDGRHYLVVEYVNGGNLRQLLDRERPLPLPRVLQIGLELADALSRTHHLRIIHRDLKPANVLLTSSGTPKLTDFGVASMADSHYLTQTGMWVGTPHYLSPEACNGEKLDARADIWAFGVMLYEMLTGKIPFSGDTLIATLTAIFRHPLPDLAILRPDLPESLVLLVQHMLIKERDRRLNSMRLVAAELEAILQGKPSPGQLGPILSSLSVDLTQLPLVEFEVIVGEALKRFRDGDWLGLAESPLAYSPLVELYFLPGEPMTRDGRAQALSVLLRWGIEKLNPGGPHSWLGSSWRHHNILHHFYVEGQRVNDLAEFMAIAPQTFFSAWRPQAVNALAKILQDELSGGQAVDERRRFTATDRYRRRSKAEQHLLRLLTIFEPEAFVRADWIDRLAMEIDATEGLHDLLEAYLVQRDESGTAVRLHPSIHPYLADLPSPKERRAWHSLAATFYREARDYLAAARQFRLADDCPQAAQILIEYRQAIFDQLQTEGLRALLTEFKPAELMPDRNLWAQLKIIAGKVAEYLENIETALMEYGEALSATDIYTKAQAYHLRAKLLQRHNLDECLAHYAYIVNLVENTLLTTHQQPNERLFILLIRLYIDRAWVYIQERPDWARAEADLTRTQEILAATAVQDRRLWSDVYNAWAGLSHKQGHLEQAISHRLQAWIAANETGDVELIMKTSHNLGQDYLWARQYPQGLTYLQKSIDLAQKTGNLQMQGSCHKGIGACHFFEKRYPEAIAHYRLAYQIWRETANPNWQAATCYDLAEAYSEIGDLPTARQFYQEGRDIASALGYQRTLIAFEALLPRYPMLNSELNRRQEQVMAYVKTERAIGMQQYIELTGVSRSQAHRDLRDLVIKGILRREGQGRATCYILNNQKSMSS